MIIIFENFDRKHFLIEEYSKTLDLQIVYALELYTFLDYLRFAKMGNILLVGSWDTIDSDFTDEERFALNNIYSAYRTFTIYNRENTTQELDVKMMNRKMYMEVIAFYNKKTQFDV